jgi:CRP/FNR family transcriptional regulator, polysaccharide utilization system transcription regulator
MNEINSPGKSYCTIEQNLGLYFNLLTIEERVLLSSKMVEINYSAGETICKQGSFANQIIIIRTGLVKLFMENGPEKLVLQILPANNIIGLSSCFEGNSIYYYSAQAYMDTTVQLIDMPTFHKLLQANLNFANKMISLLAEHNVIIYGRFYCLTRKQTYGRFADVLLCLANRIYKNNRFPLQLSRKELAELSDMSIESIARILTSFKNEKIIDLGHDYIEILDPVKLSEISTKG